jgi:hypothetical protein
MWYHFFVVALVVARVAFFVVARVAFFVVAFVVARVAFFLAGCVVVAVGSFALVVFWFSCVRSVLVVCL